MGDVKTLSTISGEIWMNFKNNVKDRKLTDAEWDKFIKDNEKICDKYKGAEKRYAKRYAQACQDYVEDVEKGI